MSISKPSHRVRLSLRIRSQVLRVPSVMSALVPALALTACASPDTETVPPRPATVQQLTVPSGSVFALTLRSVGNTQEGIATAGAAIRLRTALRTDTEAEARLCGVIVGRSRSMEALPFGWPVDSLMPYLVPQLVNGPDVQGYRVIVPGDSAEYRFEGFTTDGSTRVSFRWPVRSERSVPGDAADSEIEAALTPSPRALDTLVMGFRLATPAPAAAFRGRATTLDSVTSPRAVKLVRLLPMFPVGFTPPCGDATFSVSLSSAVDQTVRVLARKGETITAGVSSPTGKVTLGFDELGPEAMEEGRSPRVSMQAPADGHVTVRLRYNATETTEPGRQTVLLRLTSDLP